MVRVGIVGLSLLWLASGCGGPADSPRVEHADSAGVSLVRNTEPISVIPMHADTLGLIGGKAEGPQAFYRVRRALLDVDSAGRVYLLDPSRHRVFRFLPDGRVTGAWGREGQGPGELIAPLSVTVSGAGSVTVHDPGRGVFVTYGSDGELLDETPAPGAVIRIDLRHIEALPEGFAVWQREPFSGRDDRVDALSLTSETGTATLIGGRKSHTKTAQYPRCGMTFTAPIPLSPRIRWSQREDRIVVAENAGIALAVFRGANLVRRITIGAVEPPLSKSEAVALLKARGVRGPCNVEAEEFVEKQGYFPTPQRTLDVTLAPRGSIWIRYRGRDSEPEIALLDSTGAVLGRLPAGLPMPLAFLPDGRALITVADSFEVERIGIVEFRLGEWTVPPN